MVIKGMKRIIGNRQLTWLSRKYILVIVHDWCALITKKEIVSQRDVSVKTTKWLTFYTIFWMFVYCNFTFYTSRKKVQLSFCIIFVQNFFISFIKKCFLKSYEPKSSTRLFKSNKKGICIKSMKILWVV